jgi:DNA modification methylase
MITDTAPINYTTCYAQPFDTVIHSNFLNNNLPDKCANLIIADPPYFEVKGAFDFVWNSFEDYLKDVEKWAIECKRILADNGTLFWWGDKKKIAYSQIILDKYFKLENNITWEKPRSYGKQGMKNLTVFAPMTEHLLMYSNGNNFSKILSSLIGELGLKEMDFRKLKQSKNGNATGWCSNILNGKNEPIKDDWDLICNLIGYYDYNKLKRYFNNEKQLTNVFHHSIEEHITKKYDHKTIKPESLTTDLILTCSRKNDLVVVPFAGSGTEVAMSIKEGRKAIGYDIEKKYVDMSNKRIKTFKDAPSLF